MGAASKLVYSRADPRSSTVASKEHVSIVLLVSVKRILKSYIHLRRPPQDYSQIASCSTEPEDRLIM
jgi:hypothetical protein